MKQTSMFNNNGPEPNFTVAASDLKRLRGQNADILSALEDGPKFNFELAQLPTSDGKMRLIQNVTGRISDIRARLQKCGRTVVSLRLPDGLWLYKIGPNIEGSNEWLVGISTGEDFRFWNCPRCEARCRAKQSDRSMKQIVKQPLCAPCVERY